MIKLFRHQEQALEDTRTLDHVAFYHDMGLGKTYTGSEKMRLLGGRVNLVVCQKSKIDDWVEHFRDNYYSGGYDEHIILPHDLTTRDGIEMFLSNIRTSGGIQLVGIINYDLIFRRPEIQSLHIDTLMLDESSMVQNESSKRTKAVMKLKTDHVILLSGTPVGGKYERLWSQMKLLGWNITKKQYWNDFVETMDMEVSRGFSIPLVTGYKNIGKLKRTMRRHGCHFLKTDEVFDLPKQTFTTINVSVSSDYKKFKAKSLVEVDGVQIVGDNTLKQMLGERQLCGMFSKNKLEAFTDILNSTDDRLIVFYNFSDEYKKLKDICKKAGRKTSAINGQTRDLTAYDTDESSVTLIQYQAGAMGLNLQKANKIVYFTPPLSSELYEQSKKRTHRIGQERPCFYWNLVCEDSVEEKIYEALSMREDYTEMLFMKG